MHHESLWKTDLNCHLNQETCCTSGLLPLAVVIFRRYDALMNSFLTETFKTKSPPPKCYTSHSCMFYHSKLTICSFLV